MTAIPATSSPWVFVRRQGLPLVLLAVATAFLWSGGSLCPGPGSSWLEVVDVSAEFAQRGVRDHSFVGGWAEEVTPSSPARIFRKNPSDRSDLWSQTAADDWFLEDPYGALERGPGCGTTRLVMEAEARRASTDTLVYWITGDLWIDNHRALQVEVLGPRRIELVVFGDVHIGDDLVAGEGTEIAIYALTDPAREEASGRIFLGDETFGTLDVVDAHLYAAQGVVWARAASGVRVAGIEVAPEG